MSATRTFVLGWEVKLTSHLDQISELFGDLERFQSVEHSTRNEENVMDYRKLLWFVAANVVASTLIVVAVLTYQQNRQLEVFIKAPGAYDVFCSYGTVSSNGIDKPDPDADWMSLWASTFCRHVDGGRVCKMPYDATRERPRFQCMVQGLDGDIRYLCNSTNQLKPGEIFRVSDDFALVSNGVEGENCQIQ